MNYSYERVATFLSTIFINLKTNGLVYLRNLLIIFLIDCLVIDDEPLWEPLEWTLVQTWLLYLFFFSWVAETIVTSKYGSFTGRDKRVYFSLYKTFWLIEIWWAINLLITGVFIVVPFYFETSYTLSSVVSWWDWYNRLFFFKFIFLFFFISLIFFIIQIGLKWINWKKIFFLALLVNFILAFLLYTQFFITFFAYFSDVNWYKKSGWLDYQSLSNGPLKWGWGSSDRDHFSYHKTPLGFWFKNDSLYASIFFLFNIFIFLSLFFVFLQWLLILRKLYSTKEISFTFLIYGISTVKQFFYCFLHLYFFVILSFVYQLMRTPLELFWFDKIKLYFIVIIDNIINYHSLLFSI